MIMNNCSTVTAHQGSSAHTSGIAEIRKVVIDFCEESRTENNNNNIVVKDPSS